VTGPGFRRIRRSTPMACRWARMSRSSARRRTAGIDPTRFVFVDKIGSPPSDHPGRRPRLLHPRRLPTAGSTRMNTAVVLRRRAAVCRPRRWSRYGRVRLRVRVRGSSCPGLGRRSGSVVASSRSFLVLVPRSACFVTWLFRCPVRDTSPDTRHSVPPGANSSVLLRVVRRGDCSRRERVVTRR
jgi:hypothetical protein